MTLRNRRLVCAAATALCTTFPALAREPDLRLAAAPPRPAAPQIRLSKDRLALLTPMDRNSLRIAQTTRQDRQLGAFDLSLETTRMRGGSSEPSAFGDRYSANVATLQAAFEPMDGLLAGPSMSLMRMRRRFSIMPSSARPATTQVATAGIRMWRDGGSVVSLDYVSAGTRSTSALDRMAALAGGAPLRGQGLRLGITGGELADDGQIAWRLSVASMQRPRGDFAFDNTRGTVTDRRAEISLSKVF